jgi:hypothetical protein
MPEKDRTEPETGSADAKHRAVAAIGAAACIVVAAIVVALSFLF